MPRVYKVKKCRKDQGACTKCGTAIKTGDAYTYWEFRISMGSQFGTDRRIRCSKPECQPTPKDLTKSEFWGAVYGLQESTCFTDAEDMDTLESTRDDVVGELENIKSEQEDKLNNMPEGLQQGDTGQMIQERIDALDDVINNLGGVDCSFDEPEPDEEEQKARDAWEEANKDLPKDKQKPSPAMPKTEAARAEALTERIQEVAEELLGYLNDISCS